MSTTRKEATPRLALRFAEEEINFYSCSIRLVEGKPDAYYDWTTDLMSRKWDPRKAALSLSKHKSEEICDVLLDQTIFSGAGNIIKNEVLFRTRTNPQRHVASLTSTKRKQIVADVHDYSLLFYKWKKKFQLRKHWQIYKKQVCPRCGTKVVKDYLGQRSRLTCYCPNCQS